MPYVYKELLFAAGIIAVAVVFFVQGGSLPGSAGMLPRLMSVLLVILACFMMYHAVKDNRERGAEEPPWMRPIKFRRVALFLAMIVAYVALAEPLGYFVVTPLFIIVTYLALRAVKPVTAVIIAVGFSAFIYALFVRLLHLPVPLGVLQNILEM